MGCYEREQQMIAAGTAERGRAVLDYFAELDAEFNDETKFLTHRPNYTKTLFAPEHDDIYRELCAFIDLPKPRFFDAIENPITVNGYTAAIVYYILVENNKRAVSIDGAAVYNMLVKLRTQPEIAEKILARESRCFASGC